MTMTLFPVSFKRKTRKYATCLTYSAVVFTIVLVLLKLCKAIFTSSNNDADIILNRKVEPFGSVSPLSCSKNGSSLFLFISVPSAINNFKERVVIRKAWGSVAKSDPSLKLVFFVGASDNQKINHIVTKENEIYNDVIRVNVKEMYENLAKKSISILQWIHVNCNRAKYYIKVDDDIFLNVRNLIDDLKRMKPSNSIMGCKVTNTSPFRFPLSKWYISRKQYSPDTFPDYISGPAYVITGDIISKLYLATNVVERIFLEDVYVNGICRQYINADAFAHPGFTCGYRDDGPCGAHFRHKITGHHYYPEEIERMWNELNDRWYTCPLKHSFLVSKIVDTLNFFI
ncbi:beta-1,3-galactosyltransferase 1-like [Saccostrea cucullata]|uniref:beta-1,3-galactosyltransferase 1-like n=1 Tax=Saccostrea cuccullata TaxID=36930 RepID=UPI002ED2BCED